MPAERELVARFQKAAQRLGNPDPFPWCDCAHVARGSSLELLSVDSFSRGVHYPAWASPKAAGGFAVAAALSDIAACGGRATGLLLALVVPGGAKARAQALFDGAAAACAAFGVPMLGGDTKNGGGETVAVTALGETTRKRHLSLTGARPGDAVVLTGPLGGPAAAVHLAARGKLARPRLQRHLLGIFPRFAHAELLAPVATAATDLSDGLSRALHVLARRGRVGFEIGYEALPAARLVEEAAHAKGGPKKGSGLSAPFPRLAGEPLREALLLHYGGEYELVATVPPDRLARLRSACRARDLPLHQIGRVTEGPWVELHARGETRRLPEGGWEHFK